MQLNRYIWKGKVQAIFSLISIITSFFIQDMKHSEKQMLKIGKDCYNSMKYNASIKLIQECSCL